MLRSGLRSQAFASRSCSCQQQLKRVHAVCSSSEAAVADKTEFDLASCTKAPPAALSPPPPPPWRTRVSQTNLAFADHRRGVRRRRRRRIRQKRQERKQQSSLQPHLLEELARSEDLGRRTATASLAVCHCHLSKRLASRLGPQAVGRGELLRKHSGTGAGPPSRTPS